MNIVPVVLWGGAGTRLWPVSHNGKVMKTLLVAGAGYIGSHMAKRLSQLGCAVT